MHCLVGLRPLRLGITTVTEGRGGPCPRELDKSEPSGGQRRSPTEPQRPGACCLLCVLAPLRLTKNPSERQERK